MTSKAHIGKRKKQKAGLNKSILDVGFGMLKSTIKYKVEQIGGVFIEVPTKKVKPSQTCPKCGHQHKKTLDVRVHECSVCGYVQDRDVAAAEVMLYWAKGTLPGFGTSLVCVSLAAPFGEAVPQAQDSASRREDADVAPRDFTHPQNCGKYEATRTREASKIYSYWAGCRNPPFYEVRAGSSFNIY